jgi:hypothetical protein
MLIRNTQRESSMLRTRDLIVLVVSYSTMAGGIFFPSLEPVLRDAPFYCVIVPFFLCGSWT